jgi:hypothetical protein
MKLSCVSVHRHLACIKKPSLQKVLTRQETWVCIQWAEWKEKVASELLSCLTWVSLPTEERERWWRMWQAAEWGDHWGERVTCTYKGRCRAERLKGRRNGYKQVKSTSIQQQGIEWKTLLSGPREMAQRVRTLNVPAEDLSLVPSTHINSSSGLWGDMHVSGILAHVHTQT